MFPSATVPPKRSRIPPGVLTREVARRHGEHPLVAEVLDEFAEAELVEALGGVDQDEAVSAQTSEEVHLMQQRRVLDDQRVGFHDRLAHADLAIVDAAERDHRRARALGAEAREGLCMATLVEGRDREHLGRGDNALAATAVDSHLEHRLHSQAAGRGARHRSTH
jgi:hypothetical protein